MKKYNASNRPPHIITDSLYIFITVRTINGQWILKPERYKKILLDIIINKTKLLDIKLLAYAILHNHYHMMILVKNTTKLSKLMSLINGASSREINTIDGVVGRKIWWNYFDSAIGNEADFYRHLNYIHQNSIKHNITSCLRYDFSSYDEWLNKRGEEYLREAFQKYPIKDFLVNCEDS